MTEALEPRVRSLLEGAVRAGYAPGLAAGWTTTAEEGPPSLVAVGDAAVGCPSKPLTSAAWFDLASLTKPLVVGTSIILAIRDGALSLTTTVADVVPAAAGREIGARTVRHLLTHSSGLPAWAPLYALADSRRDPAVLETLCGLAVGESGVHVVYSCPGFILLGKMIERAAGVSLDRFFHRRVLRPLGLDDELGFRPLPERPLTGGAASPEAERRLLVERGLDPRLIPAVGPGLPDDGNARFLGGVSGNAGLFGSTAGVLALAGAYLEDDTLLTADERRLATGDHTPGLEQARGLGWQLAASPGCSAGPALGPGAFGHTGFTGTSVWVDPGRGLTMALLTNRVHPGHRETDLHPLRRRFHQLVVESLG